MKGYPEALKKGIKGLLFLTAITPLLFDFSHIYAYTFVKITWLFGFLEAAVLLFGVYLVISFVRADREGSELIKNGKEVLKQPLVWLLILFLAVMTVGTITAIDSYHAFWGDVNRGEGLIAWAHYLFMAVMMIVLFNKDDFRRYAVVTILVGVGVMIYAWFQYFGVENFIFAQPPHERPGSFLGSSTYLAAYLTLIVAVIGWLWSQKNYIGNIGRRWLIAVLVLVAGTVLITQTRGAILGLGVGAVVGLIYYWFKSDRGSKGRYFWGVMFIIIGILVGGFWLTREASFWQAIPGINRLAEVSLSEKNVATRLISAKIGLKAVADRPILGFGPESYLWVFNNYYEPEYFKYETGWFDRAHNKIVEVMVMYGLLGLVIYLAWIGRWWQETYRFGEKKLPEGGAIIIAGITAYFIQNLFAFDSPTSYLLMIFLMAAVVIRGERKSKEEEPETKPIGLLSAGLGMALIILAAAGLYMLRFVPYKQSYTYMARAEEGSYELEEALPQILKPETYIQPALRIYMVEQLKFSGAATDKAFKGLVDQAVMALEEIYKKRPYDPRPYQLLAEFHIERGRIDPEAYKKAEEYAREALKISPDRQSLIYLMAVAKANQGKFEEALAEIEKAIETSPEVPQSYYYYGSILADAEPDRYEEAKEYLDKARRMGWVLFEKDFDNYAKIYFAFRDWNGLASIAEAAIETYPEKEKYYKNAIVAYRGMRKAEGVIKYAEALKELSDDEKIIKDLNVIIRLAEEKDWETLDKI